MQQIAEATESDTEMERKPELAPECEEALIEPTEEDTCPAVTPEHGCLPAGGLDPYSPGNISFASMDALLEFRIYSDDEGAESARKADANHVRTSQQSNLDTDTKDKDCLPEADTKDKDDHPEAATKDKDDHPEAAAKDKDDHPEAHTKDKDDHPEAHAKDKDDHPEADMKDTDHGQGTNISNTQADTQATRRDTLHYPSKPVDLGGPEGDAPTVGTECPSTTSSPARTATASTGSVPSSPNESILTTRPEALQAIPDNKDKNPCGAGTQQPAPALVLENLTNRAAAQRLRRVMQPRKDGTHLVPQEFVEMYKDTSSGGREKIEKLFEKMSFSVDQGFQTYWNKKCISCVSQKTNMYLNPI